MEPVSQPRNEYTRVSAAVKPIRRVLQRENACAPVNVCNPTTGVWPLYGTGVRPRYGTGVRPLPICRGRTPCA